MGIDVWGSHGCACGVPMDVHAGLTRGSYRWRTRDPWMMHNEVKGPLGKGECVGLVHGP